MEGYIVVATQATLYVHIISMLGERAGEVQRLLHEHPNDRALLRERHRLSRSLGRFRARLLQIEEAVLVQVDGR
jgi:hypothetical protein